MRPANGLSPSVAKIMISWSPLCYPHCPSAGVSYYKVTFHLKVSYFSTSFIFILAILIPCFSKLLLFTRYVYFADVKVSSPFVNTRRRHWFYTFLLWDKWTYSMLGRSWAFQRLSKLNWFCDLFKMFGCLYQSDFIIAVSQVCHEFCLIDINFQSNWYKLNIV